MNNIHEILHCLEHFGLNSLSLSEQLALIFAKHDQDKAALNKSERLVAGLQHIDQLTQASCTALSRLDQAKVLCLSQFHLQFKQTATSTVLSSKAALQAFFSAQLQAYSREILMVLLLEQNYRYLNSKVLFSGTIDRVAVYPREIIRFALLNNASYIAIAHNHLNGNKQLSQADLNLSAQLEKQLECLQLGFAGHFIA